VAQSGELLRWNTKRPAAEVWKSLTKTQLTSASFSVDGSWLLFTPSTHGGDAELWMRTRDDYAYHQTLDLTNKNGTSTPIRQQLWSPDSRVLVVISGRLDQTVSDVLSFRTE
jgi:Tol biopolymer transport system component